jgi:predicted ATP-grasp superfamily ATP-dependent carboligase
MTQKAPGALIVGGAHVSIAVARSLGRRGIPVWLLSNHPIPTYSRYVKRSFPWPGADHADGLSAIIDLAKKHGLQGWVLIATGDQDMRLIAKNHALLSQYFRVATPDWETIQWAYDKRLTYQRAAELRIDFPKSFEPRNVDEVAQLECRFPVILKPAFRKGMDEFTQAKAWKADDRKQLTALYLRASALVGSDAIIVQEWIPGAGEAQFSYAALCERGEPLVSMTARRSRQHPIDFGRSSTFVESIEQNEVEALARRLLKSLNYTGVVEVEFKHDSRDGHYKLLDVNGRFWTWNGLGELAGVNFPYLAWRQAMGMRVVPARAKPGVAWMHTSRDVLAALGEFRAGNLSAGQYLKSFTKPLAFANFAIDDPMPAIVELPVAAWNRLAHTLRGRHVTAQKQMRRRLAK